jgi:hypothetical protein
VGEDETATKLSMKTDTKTLELQAGALSNRLRPPVKTWHQLRETVHAAIQRDFSSLSQRQPRLLQVALDEAAALAWWSKFPELFFPALAHEKVEAVAKWDARQRALFLAEHSDSTGLAA